MAEVADLIFVASGRWVCALDRFSGRPVWRQKMPRMFGGLITLMQNGRELFVGRGGYVYCLEARTGQTLWERGLDGGQSMVMMAGAGDQGAVAAEVMAQQQAAAAGIAASVAATSAAS